MKQNYWQDVLGVHRLELPDPRLAIARYIGWVAPTYRFGKETTWSFPEPDNINRGIWHKRSHDIPGIKYQQWYRDQQRGGWFSNYYVDSDSERNIFEDYVKNNEVWSVWRYDRAAKPRHRCSWIEFELRRFYATEKKSLQRCASERLFDQGFIEKLIDRGASAEYINKVIGQPRPNQSIEILNNILEDTD